jgi:hypothetical protein
VEARLTCLVMPWHSGAASSLILALKDVGSSFYLYKISVVCDYIFKFVFFFFFKCAILVSMFWNFIALNKKR